MPNRVLEFQIFPSPDSFGEVLGIMSAPPPPPVPVHTLLSPQLPDSSLVLSDADFDYAERIALEAKIKAVPEHTPVRPVVVVAKEVRDTAFGGAKDVDCFIWVDINGVAVVDASKRVYRTLAYNEIASWAVQDGVDDGDDTDG